jgi:uncharacterized protein (DUF885 family)
MSSNQRRNEAALKKYRKDLEAMLGDIREVDKRVLNKAVNAGLVVAKQETPVGSYSKEVNFTTKEGKVVNFSVGLTKVGGHMRRNWFVTPTKKTSSGVEKKLFNTAEYASYVNYGHRIVRKGITLGFVKGKFILERAINKVETVMVNEFRKAIEEVNRKYGK